MKKRSTYRLLVQSEEKSRNILEMALYALFALSALVTIWQFADGPGPLTRTQVQVGVKQTAGSQIPS